MSRRTTYEDDYARREPSGRRDPRDDRHARDRGGDARERTRAVEDPRVSGRVDAMDIVDPRMAAPRGLGDPRGANAAARLEPRADRHGNTSADPRSGPPRYYTDPRTGKLVEVRQDDDYAASAAPREYGSRRGMTMDDSMDHDMDTHPTTRRSNNTRDTTDSRDQYMEEPKSTKYNDYFVPGSGM